MSENLLDVLQRLDYSGTFQQVLARLTDEHLAAFQFKLNVEDAQPYLYFALRRFAVERGSPLEVTLDSKKGRDILNLSTYLLTMEEMRRRGDILVEFSDSPFMSPAAPVKISVTEKGIARKRELDAKERAGL